MGSLTLVKVFGLCSILHICGSIADRHVNEPSFRPQYCQVSPGNCNNCCDCGSSDECTGDCKKGYHGALCKNACRDNCVRCKDHSDTTSHQGYANCTECKDGFYVTEDLYQCQLPCPSGCKSCSSDTNCSICKDGFNGSNCDECVSGKHGTDCSKNCSTTCMRNECNRTDGVCYSCKTGTYGKLCNMSCPEHCLNKTCNMSGLCTACEELFNGTTCETCISGKYGANCSLNCSLNCQEKNCNRSTGECFSCKGNFDGSFCKNCTKEKYGKSCNNSCPDTCNETVCDQMSGNCTFGCISNYDGHNCSECTRGHYGNSCDNNCSINCTGKCNRSSGSCTACKEGFFGPYCNRSCPANCGDNKCNQTDGSCAYCNQTFHGMFCNESCPEHCTNGTCDQNNHTCTEGCEDMFIGDKCESCIPGRYGEACNTTCPENCKNDTCEKSNGNCFWCDENFNGTKCEACAVGLYGRHCNRTCPGNCIAFTCDILNGTCGSGCTGNFSGKTCNECKEGLFGGNCSQICPINCENDTCQQETGYCSKCIGNYSGSFCDKCKEGLNGEYCEKECPRHCLGGCERENGACLACVDGFNGTTCEDCQDDRYGVMCNESCPEQCLHTVCDRNTGNCTHGCNENFVGDHCNVCTDGKYGDMNCSVYCPVNCVNDTCDMLTGRCYDCVGNFTGDWCDDCLAGLYEQNCTGICSDKCFNKTCDKETGRCNMCRQSRHGTLCELPCSNNCLQGSCHQLTGHCSLGCSQGYTGSLCETVVESFSLTIPVVISSIVVVVILVVLVVIFLRKKRAATRIDKGDSATLVPHETDNGTPNDTEAKKASRLQHEYVNVVLIQDPGGHITTSIEQTAETFDDTAVEADIARKSLVNNDKPDVEGSVEVNQISRISKQENGQPDTEIEPIVVSEVTERKCTVNKERNDDKIKSAPDSTVALLDASETVNRLSTLERDKPFVPRRINKSKRAVKSEMLEMRESKKLARTMEAKLVNDKQLRVFSQMYSNQTTGMVGSGVVQLEDLAEYVTTRDDAFFEMEFLKLPKGLLKPHDDAIKPQNISKNRYNAIYPYDENRVRLKGTGTNYINASFVNGYSQPNQFIAALGPIRKATDNFETFWRMIWQQKVDKIVMVTNLMENAAMKCEQYWPNESTTTMYGSVKVTCLMEQTFAEFVVRTFKVEKDKECRQLLHFHFTSWPDKAAPEEVTSIIDFRYIVNDTAVMRSGGPIVVHCSAGIGRTGTYVALEILTDQGRAENCVNVFGCVSELRQQRTSMVQKWEQYGYIHRALVHSLLLDSDPVSVENFPHRAADERHLTKTFNKLSLVIDPLEDDDIEAIRRNMSRTQHNREGADIPGDRYRVRLYQDRILGQTDYINAVYVDGFTSRKKYILTQTPLRETVQDFLTLVLQEKCSCIVTLDDLQPGQNVGIYVPRDSKSRLSISDNLRVSCTDIINMDAYAKKVLTIDKIKDTGSKTHTVSHFRFKGWRHASLTPESAADFVQLVQEVTEAAEDSGCPIIVQCLTGAERSGVYCAVSNLLERLTSVREASVVNVVRKVQFRRPTAIGTKEQFIFCHEAVCEFLKTISGDVSGDDSGDITGSSSSDGVVDDDADHVYGNVSF